MLIIIRGPNVTIIRLYVLMSSSRRSSGISRRVLMNIEYGNIRVVIISQDIVSVFSFLMTSLF